jgi:hypothetical protein
LFSLFHVTRAAINVRWRGRAVAQALLLGTDLGAVRIYLRGCPRGELVQEVYSSG